MINQHAISLPAGDSLFNFRVAGIAVLNGKLLLHKTAEDHFWSLPGGRCDMFEFSKETLQREMVEETGQEVEVQKMAWIVENFFEYRGIRHHEIGFYYRMRFTGLTHQDDFVFQDGDNTLLYRWIPVSEVDYVPVYPEIIKSVHILNELDFKHFTIGLQNLGDPHFG